VIPQPVAVVAVGTMLAAAGALNADQRIRIGRAIRNNRLRLEAHTTPRTLARFHADPSRKRILVGPNQGGKTWAGAKEALWLMGAMPHPFREAFNARRPWDGRPVRGWVVCYSEKQSRTIQRTIRALVPRHMLASQDFNESRGFLNGQIVLTNGSILEVKTAGQETLGLASDTLDFVWIDEPPPENLYSELISRLLVKSGSLIITCTPIGRPVEWLKKLADAGEISYHRFSLSAENCPHLTAIQIEEQKRDVLPHERPQRIHGAWEGVTPDRLFDQFVFPVNLHGAYPDTGLQSNVINVPDWWPRGRMAILVAFDWGEGAGKTTAVAIAVRPGRLDPNTGRRVAPRTWALGEYVSPGATTIDQDAAGTVAMLAALGLTPARVDRWVGDVNTAGKSAVGRTVNEMMGEALAALAADAAGLDPQDVPAFTIETADKSPGSVDFGCRIINVAAGRRELFVKAGEGFGCPALHRAIQHWQGGKTGKDGEYTHILDAFRYGVTAAMADTVEYSYLRIRYAA
jgi:phage terminase large subunit-like protein